MIEKGTKEFEFWGDIYKFKSKYTPPQDDIQFFIDMWNEGKAIVEKYKDDQALYALAYDTVMSIANVLNNEIMKNKRGFTLN